MTETRAIYITGLTRVEAIKDALNDTIGTQSVDRGGPPTR